MFCPGCGSEERQASQFCRACGTDLRVVRMGLERPDSITASAESAREEIGRAVAERIRQMEDAHTMERFAHHILPEVEKFLESPEEKRLRRLRSGTITALVSLAVGIPSMLLIAVVDKRGPQIGLGWLSVFALISFATGLALLINGLLFSKPRKEITDRSSHALAQDLLDGGYARPPAGSRAEANPRLRAPTTSNLVHPPGSVTEHTTLHLKSER
jgi:hypothetical protein